MPDQGSVSNLDLGKNASDLLHADWLESWNHAQALLLKCATLEYKLGQRSGSNPGVVVPQI